MLQRLISACAIALLGLMVVGGFAVRAQDATPTMEGGLPVTPDPSECTAAEATEGQIMERMGAMDATPGAGAAEAMSDGTPEAFTLPEGEPADAATTLEITALMREVLACINTGDFLRIFAYTTDNFLTQLLSEEDEGAGGGEGTPVSETMPPDAYATLVAVHDVTVLPDGSIGALVETIFPDEEPGVQVDYFTFVEQDGRWLIDGIVEDLEGEFPPQEMGTPEA